MEIYLCLLSHGSSNETSRFCSSYQALFPSRFHRLHPPGPSWRGCWIRCSNHDPAQLLCPDPRLFEVPAITGSRSVFSKVSSLFPVPQEPGLARSPMHFGQRLTTCMSLWQDRDFLCSPRTCLHANNDLLFIAGWRQVLAAASRWSLALETERINFAFQALFHKQRKEFWREQQPQEDVLEVSHV